MITAAIDVQMALGGDYASLVVADAPACYLRLGELEGTTAEDASGNNRDGTYQGNPTLGVRGECPDGDLAVLLDGVGDYVNIPNAAVFQDSTFAIEMIIDPTNLSETRAIAGKWEEGGNQRSWYLELLPNGKLRWWISTDGTLLNVASADSTGTIPTGVRTHVVVTAGTPSSPSVTFYINGAAAGSGTPGVPFASSTAPVTVGARGDSYFLGAIDEFAFYSSIAIAAKVLAHWTALQWTSVKRDIRIGRGLRAGYGIRGDGVRDRVASSGLMTFGLNNAADNSGGKVGYYSPDHVDARAGFGIGTPCRLVIAYTGVTYYKWRGRVVDIRPTAGVRRDRDVLVICADWMDAAARTTVTNIATQISKRADEVFRTIVQALDVGMGAVSIQQGTDTYAYALDNLKSEEVAGLTLLQYLALSEQGFIYQKGDLNGGGTLVHENRSARSLASVTDTFNDDLLQLDPSQRLTDVINRVRVAVHPRAVDAAATSVLYSLPQPQSSAVAQNETIVIDAPYTDPNQRAARVGGTSMVTPVATTDYTMNSLADGSGTDLTGNFTVAVILGGNSVRFTITNTGVTAGYITKLQVRGKGIYDYAPVYVEASDADSQRLYRETLVQLDMPYQNDPRIGKGAADRILLTYSEPRTFAREAIVQANDSDAHMLTALQREVSDLIGISETVSGLDAMGYFINAIDLTVGPGDLLTARFTLAPSDTTQYWILETVGRSELGVSTWLAAV